VSRSARGRSARARHSARFPRLFFPASQRPPVCFVLRGRARCQASCFSLPIGLQQEHQPVLLVALVTTVSVWFCSYRRVPVRIVALINLSVPALVSSDFDFSIACGSLQGEAGIILELSDQKARGFIVQIALPR
jgi:hypothetical protein